MKINRSNPLYKALHRLASTPPVNPDLKHTGLFIGRQTDINPVDPNKRDLPELDNSPEAAEAREKAAKRSVWIPLAAILGGAAALAIGVMIKLYF